MAKAKRRQKRGTTLEATRMNGRKVRANTRVSMSLKSLRRIVKGAASGRKVKVKARVR